MKEKIVSQADSEIDRIVISGAGFAIVGSALAGPVGAFVGGIFGLFIGFAANDAVRKSQKK